MFSEVSFLVPYSHLRWDCELNEAGQRSFIARGGESQGDSPTFFSPRRWVPLLATKTPRRLSFAYSYCQLCARSCAELVWRDRRGHAAQAAVKRPGAVPGPASAHTEKSEAVYGRGTGARAPTGSAAPAHKLMASEEANSSGVTTPGRCDAQPRPPP